MDSSEQGQKSKVRKLRPKQERFVEHYVMSGNGAEAARLAGYSEHTARNIASENLTKPDISAAIADKVAPIYTIESLQRALTKLLDDPTLSAGNRIKGIELALKNLGALTERREINSHATLSRAFDTSSLSVDDLTRELVERLRLSSQGIDTTREQVNTTNDGTSVQVSANE